MHIDTVIVLSGINLGIGGWLIYRLENCVKYILDTFLSAIKDTYEDTHEDILNEAVHTRNHVTEQSENTMNHTDASTEVATTETHSRIEALSTHLSTHADDLVKQTEQLKAHARAVIDVSAQQQAKQSRIICSKCNRVVYKFTPEGICLDCQAKG